MVVNAENARSPQENGLKWVRWDEGQHGRIRGDNICILSDSLHTTHTTLVRLVSHCAQDIDFDAVAGLSSLIVKLTVSRLRYDPVTCAADHLPVGAL